MAEARDNPYAGRAAGRQAAAAKPDPGEDGGACEACGYSFAGRQSITRCPECGTSLLEMLRKRQKSDAVRFTSEKRIGSWPLYDIIVKPGSTDPRATARGIFASGPKAVGFVATGGIARGVIAMGGVSMGVFAMGGISLGLCTAMGGMAIGSFAFGGMAAGGVSFGGMTTGLVPFGGMRLPLARMLGVTIDPGLIVVLRRALMPLVATSTMLPVVSSLGMTIFAGMLTRRARAGADR
jgi:hypothetical protein